MEFQQDARIKRYLPDLAATIALVLFWWFICSNIFSDFDTKLYLNGQHTDAINSIWTAWWTGKVFSTPDLSLFNCTYLNFPAGVVVMAQDFAFLHIYLTGILSTKIGIVPAINTVFVSVLLFSAFTAYFFFRRLTKSRFLSFIFASTLLVYFPYLNYIAEPKVYPPGFPKSTSSQAFVDVETANFGFLMLALGLWIMLLERGSKKLTALAGVILGIVCLTQMYYGICAFLILGLGFAASFASISPVKGDLKLQRKKTLTVMAIGAAIMFATLFPSLKDLAGRGVFMEYNFQPHAMQLGGALIIISVCIITAIIFRGSINSTWFWILATILLVVASAELTIIAGQAYKLPTAFVKQKLPFLWRLTFTDRYLWMSIIPFLAFIAVLAEHLRQKYSSYKKAWAPLTVLMALIAIFCASIMINKGKMIPLIKPYMNKELPEVPEFFYTMGQDKELYSIFTLDSLKAFYQPLQHYYQAFHHKPIGGYGLIPIRFIDPTTESEVGKMQRRLTTKSDRWTTEDFPDKNWYDRFKIRYIVVFDSFFNKAGEDFLQLWESSNGVPVFVSDRIRVYDVRKIGS